MSDSATPWTTACRAPLSFPTSQSLLRFMSVDSVMLSNHLILCYSLLLLPSIFPRIRVFSSESALCIRRVHTISLLEPSARDGDIQNSQYGPTGGCQKLNPLLKGWSRKIWAEDSVLTLRPRAETASKDHMHGVMQAGSQGQTHVERMQEVQAQDTLWEKSNPGAEALINHIKQFAQGSYKHQKATEVL